MAEGQASAAECEAQPRFGTFLGVFTPSVLTILGVIMYLRFGWVVGHVGLAGAIAIVLLSNAISFITALSASSVATNMPMGAGGEYYLISRSLGLTIGGAIGIPLFLCRTLSVTLYCFGLAESIAMFWPAGGGAPPVPWLAAGLIVTVTAIAGKSAAASLRLQVPLMVVVGLSLVALAVGVFVGPLRAPQWLGAPQRLADVGGFWVVLAVFFPAVTGFTAGVGMSGDLRNPQRSIPRGTMAAVTVGAVAYLGTMILLGVSDRVSMAELAAYRPGDPSPWFRLAWLGAWLVMPGMVGAILSSAFGSALGGPRVLQALARDGLVPAFLGRTSRTGQPTIATWVAGGIALAAVLLGDLNAVAEMVTIFFLTLYVSVNVVAAAERLVGNPSFRPTLRVPWAVSLLGAAGSLVVMFLISPWACGVAMGLELVVWWHLRRRHLQASWGTLWAGVWGTLVRLSLHRLTRQTLDVRTWRPNLVLFTRRVEQHADVVRLSAWFNQNRGILTVCHLLVGRPEDHRHLIRPREEAINAFFEREGILAFAEVSVVRDLLPGILAIVQANGVGPLRTNTVIFGWPQRVEGLASLLGTVREIDELGCATLLIRPAVDVGLRRYDRVDVWWRGRENNGDLMLLLAYLLTLNAVWRRAEIVVRSIVDSPEEASAMSAGLDELIRAVRIEARQDVIVRPQDRSVVETIRAVSRDASVVFLGLKSPAEDQQGTYAGQLLELVDELPTTVLVRNSGPFRGRLI